MTTANETYFHLKQELTPRQTQSILDFVNFRNTTNDDFSKLVQEHQEVSPVLYRGIHYPLKNLQIGMTYQHFESLSSWSTDFDVARSFNQGNDLLETFIEEMAVEMGFDLTNLESFGDDWQKAVNAFVDVVFTVKNQCGFSVNKFIDHAIYSPEKEFVIYEGEWTIVDVAENYDVHGQRFYLVELE